LGFGLRTLRFGQRQVNVITQLKPDYLSRQDLRARTKLNKLNLAFSVVQNFRKRFVHEIELCLVEPERHGKFQLLCRAGFDDGVMKRAITIQVIRIAIDRLLKITDHAELPWARRIAFGLKPLTARFDRPRAFEQNTKLLRICVLSFVEEDAIVLTTDLR